MTLITLIYTDQVQRGPFFSL